MNAFVCLQGPDEAQHQHSVAPSSHAPLVAFAAQAKWQDTKTATMNAIPFEHCLRKSCRHEYPFQQREAGGNSLASLRKRLRVTNSPWEFSNRTFQRRHSNADNPCWHMAQCTRRPGSPGRSGCQMLQTIGRVVHRTIANSAVVQQQGMSWADAPIVGSGEKGRRPPIATHVHGRHRQAFQVMEMNDIRPELHKQSTKLRLETAIQIMQSHWVGFSTRQDSTTSIPDDANQIDLIFVETVPCFQVRGPWMTGHHQYLVPAFHQREGDVVDKYSRAPGEFGGEDVCCQKDLHSIDEFAASVLGAC